MRRLITLLLVGLFAIPGVANAQKTVSVGVFLPQANFPDNAQRGLYADSLAKAMSSASNGAYDFQGRAFAKRTDLMAFLKAGKLDIIVTDAVFQAGRGGKILAHAVGKDGKASRAAVLYGRSGSVLGLKGKVIAVTDVGGNKTRFYVNTALGGEVDPKSFFGDPTARKDVYAALGAVKAEQASAAFAPANHPAATGLKVLAKGGQVPLAVMVAVNTKRLDEAAQQAALAALKAGSGKGGGIAGWRTGAGSAYSAASSAAKRSPRVLSTMPILTASDVKSARPPRAQLKAAGKLPAPSVANATIYPTLSE